MHILVVGATGFIGSAVSLCLVRRGATVTGLSRSSSTALPISHVVFDIASATEAVFWAPLLRGIDAVVYCGGSLQGRSLEAVHHLGPRALFAACKAAGVRRVIHISALGVERHVTAFSRTKLAGDEALMASDLDWAILRPSVVMGRNAFGGAALLRGLAALPILPVLRGAAPLQVVQLDDLLETVAFFLQPAAPVRAVVELVGPRAWSFDALVGALRRWLGWRPARTVPLPRLLAATAFAFGDLMSMLGWRSALTTTAGQELMAAPAADGSRWQELTGIKPTDLEDGLLSEPAPVQERWFAALYLLRPILFAVCALYWIATGVISLGPAWRNGLHLMEEGGILGWQAAVVLGAGGLCDIAIGLLIGWRRTAPMGVIFAVILTATYAVIGTLLVPRLWVDPMGPILKVLPILVLHLAMLSILQER